MRWHHNARQQPARARLTDTGRLDADSVIAFLDPGADHHATAVAELRPRGAAGCELARELSQLPDAAGRHTTPRSRA